LPGKRARGKKICAAAGPEEREVKNPHPKKKNPYNHGLFAKNKQSTIKCPKGWLAEG
jgi:hypothetical protein